MENSAHASLVAAYWHHYITTHVLRDDVEGDRWFWAWQHVDEAVRSADVAALVVVVALANSCHSTSGLAFLGAGPLEDLVKAADGALFDRIINVATDHARFRRALATIWIKDRDKVQRLKTFFRLHRRFPMTPSTTPSDRSEHQPGLLSN